jgi:hypothetical protein
MKLYFCTVLQFLFSVLVPVKFHGFLHDKVDLNNPASCTSLGGINIRMLFLGL